MLTYCVRRLLTRQESSHTSLFSVSQALQVIRGRCSDTHEDFDQVSTLLNLCTDRHYISPDQSHRDSFQRGLSCSYAPLGLELRKNLLDQWWHSVTRSRAQVFGISTLSCSQERAVGGDRELKVVDTESLNQVLDLKELSRAQLSQEAQRLLRRMASLRTNIFQGALEQYVPSLDLVKKKLPFGLAETGLCFQPSDGSGCPAEVTQTSLVWFCSPRTSGQWLDHWAQQRLQWWRKFALGTSDFSSSDIPEDELGAGVSRGVRILYSFPWGAEPLETLCNRGDAELLQAHKGVRTKLLCRDGRKSVVPHVVSVTGNMDRGVMAYLCNSLQQLKRVEDSKHVLKQRKVLKLHPVLAPVKVAVIMVRGATVEIRQVCEGLLQEFLEARISAWPGYLETMSTSVEQLYARYDEMGVLFVVVVSENTLESGLLQVRSRDTTIKETMHISEVKNFLARYISAADNI
ncbi:DNA polymerase subunit gamma-2, mitochondrial [Myripristis murdjan]|uniref:DNA polymerase gamma 2, accessory subunit n=1 Tax=Myripristis murdjan TaxID=586833 RepID=A0A668A288_9TELE|nr:DNA polymerase subunit gamma-2, mitochondrial [Myripristis murdjan]